MPHFPISVWLISSLGSDPCLVTRIRTRFFGVQQMFLNPVKINLICIRIRTEIPLDTQQNDSKSGSNNQFKNEYGSEPGFPWLHNKMILNPEPNSIQKEYGSEPEFPWIHSKMFLNPDPKSI
jgi:hypothetical protein